MKLSKEARAKYNEEAATKFFKEMEGLPYGYHNFLFSWIDTDYQNYPPIIPAELVPIVFSLLDKFAHKTVDTFLG